MSLLKDRKIEAAQTYPVEQSIIQAWERQQDVHLINPHFDMLDSWSSDGGSISSSSSCFSDDHCMDSENLTLPSIPLSGLTEEKHFNSFKNTRRLSHDQKNPLHYLKSAGVYTSKEVIDQAINRWESYKNLCHQALYILRQQLVDAYIPYAIEESKASPTKPAFNETDTIPTLPDRVQRRQHAAQKMLRHSVKTANQRHLACVSKFAIVSNRIAKWCRPPTANQQCRFRDPTTTTWEKHCTNSCVPLLPVCSYHLVQIRPAPDYIMNSSSNKQQISSDELNSTNYDEQVNVKSEMSTIECDVNNNNNTVDVKSSIISPNTTILNNRSRNSSSCSEFSTLNFDKPIKFDDHNVKSQSSRLNRCSKGYFDQTSVINPISPTVQISPQYLFRRCGGGPSQNCPEPVIAWNPFIRCIYHSTITSVCTSTSSIDLKATAKDILS
ncbi:unnamed protein product [Schistosoma turkestanicum]|nr:unnamed protein product [Schistosoma turkestanicum]